MRNLKTIIENITNNNIISGLGDGEKIFIGGSFDRLIFLSSDFTSAGRIKRGLASLGKRAEIISNTRENNDERDKNLLPFVSNLSKYLAGELDALIFLPCSSIIKFELSKITSICLKKGESVKIEDVIKRLVEMGYERVSLVDGEGQFALRGDILDIFSTTNQHPVRIEFFDELIENISIFDEINMKNIEKLEKIEVFCAYLPIGEDCCFDLDGTKILDEPKKVGDEINLLIQSYSASSTFDPKNYKSFDYLYQKADYIFDNFNINSSYINDTISSRSYLTDFVALKHDIADFKNLNQSIILFTGEERYKKILENFLLENQIQFKDFSYDILLEKKDVYVSSQQFPFSASFLKEGVVVIGSDSLFKSNQVTFSKSKHSTFYLPHPGEFVVHTFHGIGKCIKIERMKISDIEKDYYVIEYKSGDLLYLPSEEANTISAYVGGENPKLSALGGGEFSRLKERVKASIKEMAISLLDIYRERAKVKGFAFKRDEYLEKKFADAFGFEETQDQMRAILDIDKDMESDKVMERLICGDVGFGKTEVALRAAFKAIYNGKQVAFLCPTTILSEQHYLTAKGRLEPFGVRVEVINRFKSNLQINEIIRRLKEGEIDMLIGTHKLLNDKIVYKDLGLLILDEEQRFGVEHKEKLKSVFKNIDVITLSATPIPRTLNMSLSGIRDISIIETPPLDRLPIQTYITEENDQLFKDVISRELARKGQVFIVYNRVESIDDFANYIRKLVPNANVGVAHGQMAEKNLENVISKLFNNEFNVLVSTTLIENGINLPSANTMIIIDADRLGLSQLYQLRGRIGRSDRLSYAYLTFDKDKIINEDAYKRLEAIKEFSSLGSGFKIAMRDLELRGAGNIFGKEQHGHIAKVGYDMYVKMLDEEVKNIKGEHINIMSDVKLEVSLSAFIGEDYINDDEQRIIYYTRIGEINTREDLESILTSLNDAYGDVPQEIKNLCLLAYLRNLAGRFLVKKIVINKNDCLVYLERSENLIDERLAKLLDEYNGIMSFDNNIKVKFNFALSVYGKLNKIIDFFERGAKNI